MVAMNVVFLPLLFSGALAECTGTGITRCRYKDSACTTLMSEADITGFSIDLPKFTDTCAGIIAKLTQPMKMDLPTKAMVECNGTTMMASFFMMDMQTPASGCVKGESYNIVAGSIYAKTPEDGQKMVYGGCAAMISGADGTEEYWSGPASDTDLACATTTTAAPAAAGDADSTIVPITAVTTALACGAALVAGLGW